MKEEFLANYTEGRFLDRLKTCFERCDSFMLSVSFIKKAGLILILDCIEKALKRGAKGRIITSTYQNFTDIPSLETFLELSSLYKNFECKLDFDCFGENGFHSKGYIFEIEGEFEFLVGSTNITRFALLNNIEWNISLTRDKNNKTVLNAIDEFNNLWSKTLFLSEDLLKLYKTQIDYAVEKWDMDYVANYESKSIVPNLMQKRALKELRRYRDMGVNKSLIVAATASGKTYLAAFDARNFDAKRLLFVVHRDTILVSAMETFQKVFMGKRTYGLFTGQTQNLDAQFIFATNTMLSTHLTSFDKDEFDYIVFDECHHATASTYQEILSYFRPRFLLGLTATPERLDNADVFSMFDKNVPYELRLRDAIKNDLVVPFKYYGIRDSLVDYSDKDKLRFLSEMATEQHIDFIVKAIEEHKQKGKLKAIAFCRNIEHAVKMASAFSNAGYCATSLTGRNLTGERLKAYTDLQDDQSPLEIICTVDILNEGVDVPGVNMVLFLRPTESQTIFIQQLGRGLRKFSNKSYLTVLDFIGNSYERSIQIAFALGSLSNTTYLEKALVTSLVKSDFKDLDLEGVEIHFDKDSSEQVLEIIKKTNFNKVEFLKQDYFNFKKYLGCEEPPKLAMYLQSDCSPDLMRFLKAKIDGTKNKSYYNFLKKIGEPVPLISESQLKIIDTLSEMLPITRREEFLIVSEILNNKDTYDNFNSLIDEYKRITVESIKSSVNYLTSLGVIRSDNDRFFINCYIDDEDFKNILIGLLEYGLERYTNEFGDFDGTFKLYGNYQKVQTILEIEENPPVVPPMLGTKYNTDTHETYLYVCLNKSINWDPTFLYHDKFVSRKVFQWESVNGASKTSPEGKKLLSTETVHLFIRKMKEEDGVTLPFTYFGKGKFTNCRETSNNGQPTLTFDVVLENEVPEEYMIDYHIEKLIN